MRSLARTHPVGAFLVLVYAWTAAAFAIPLLGTTGIGLVPLEVPGLAPFVILAALGLVTAGWLVSGWHGGPAGRAAFRHRLLYARVAPGWYVGAILALPLTALAGALAAGLNPPVLSDPIGGLVAALSSALVAFALVNWWEEAGWTGFAQDTLQPRIGPARAAVVVTWLQAAMHLPLVFVAGGVTTGRVSAGDVPLYLAALFVLPIPVRLLLAWIYNATGRSVPVAGLFHAGLGVATGAVFVSPEAGTAGLVVYAGFAILALAVLVITGGRLAYPSGAAQDSRSADVSVRSITPV